MPFNYSVIKKQAALRLAQIKGSDQTTLQSAYAGLWTAALDGAEVPIGAFKDLTLMIAKEIAQVIASNANHPARTFLYGRSVDLANLASTPSVDQGNIEFIGVFDSVADSATNAPLTLQPTQTLADTADTFFNDTDLFYYNLTGNQIRHTRPLVYLQGCIWSDLNESTNYDEDTDCPLPEVCANMLVNGIVANAYQVGWTDNANASQYALNLYQQELQLLSTGMPNIPLASQNVVAG